jgi:hypothetical protein
MKKLVFVFILLYTAVNLSAQSVEIGMGYSSSMMLNMNVDYISPSNVVYSLDGGIALPNGTKGEEYSTVNWSEYPEDVIEEGEYYNIINLGVGYKFEKFAVLGLIGYADETLYRNGYDDYNILGDDGSYYKTTKGDNGKLNVGIKGKYFIPIESGLSSSMYFTLGAQLTLVGGAGLNIGLAF